MEPEETVDYNIRKTWYNITKMYNKKANDIRLLASTISNEPLFADIP